MKLRSPLKFPKLWLTIGFLMIAVVVYASLTPTPPQIASFPQSDKFVHFVTYLILMLWFAQIYSLKTIHFLLFVGFVSMGIVLEFLQGMSEQRSFEYLDMLANSSGVLLGLILAKTPMGTCLLVLEKILMHFEKS